MWPDADESISLSDNARRKEKKRPRHEVSQEKSIFGR